MVDMRKGTCPVCEHNEILEAEVAEFGNQDEERRMCVTYDKRWVASGRNPRHGHGPLRMYVCRACGFVQWFAEAPGEIPASDEICTRLIRGPERADPYR